MVLIWARPIFIYKGSEVNASCQKGQALEAVVGNRWLPCAWAAKIEKRVDVYSSETAGGSRSPSGHSIDVWLLGDRPLPKRDVDIC